ncbi:outer membrane beta-barrel protein [Proteobacteria bacterium 005FR1]|nr:outer membrane beta-barrel protein [Proteobacteria bacterium 005FR1]
MTTLKCSALTVLAASLLAVPAFAYEAGDTFVRIGPALVSPQDDSSTLSLDGTPLAGTGASVENETQLGLTFTYMLRNNLAVELLAASPFTHVIDAEGLGIEVGEAKQLPPTLSLQFFPVGSSNAFKPYLGLGLNYTVFFSEKLSSELVAVLGDGDMELENSFGLAAQLGADFSLTDRLMLSAAVWKADIDTTAEIKLNSGSLVEVDVDIDPLVYMLGFAYKF